MNFHFSITWSDGSPGIRGSLGFHRVHHPEIYGHLSKTGFYFDVSWLFVYASFGFQWSSTLNGE